jgi:hypothetical protein
MNREKRTANRGGRNMQLPIYTLPNIKVGEGPSLEEWYDLRNAAFDELLQYPIPKDLIDAVRGYRPHAAVTWETVQGERGAAPIVEPPKIKSKAEMSQFLSDASRKMTELRDWEDTAGDVLARCLRWHLDQLRTGGSAPVRLNKMLPRSTIATIALDILDTCRLLGHLPGPDLCELLRELLDADKQKLSADRQYDARHQAAWILAQDGDYPTSDLARLLGVNKSSVSRWQRDPQFQNIVQGKKELIARFKKNDVWPLRADLTKKRDQLMKARSALTKMGRYLALFVRTKRIPESVKTKLNEDFETNTNLTAGEVEKHFDTALRDIDKQIGMIDEIAASEVEARDRADKSRENQDPPTS